MNSTYAILGPVFALAFWTFFMVFSVIIARIRVFVQGKVKASDYKLGDTSRVPYKTQLLARNYANLLEITTLFYVICLIAWFMHLTHSSLLYLAWLYVVLRIVHSVIHTTSNYILYRMLTFLLSNIVLITMWLIVGLNILKS